MANYVCAGIIAGGLLMLLWFCFSQLSECSMKNEADKEKKRFKEFEGHLVYLIRNRMSKWIRSDIDEMQRQFDIFNVNPHLLEQEAERLKLEASGQEHQEQMQQEAISRQQKLEAEHKQCEVEYCLQEAEQKQLELLKKQEAERLQKEQASALKQYWQSVTSEFNNFSKSSDDAAKKAAGMKILEISEENFSLEYLKQQYQHVLTDYVQPLQESETDKAQKKEVLEAVFQELCGWAV